MIQDRLRSLVESHYDIGNIEEVFNLEGGYWNQTLKLITISSNYVLRISPPRTLPESVNYQHDLMRFMHTRIAEVPLPVAMKNGETFFVFENRTISLLPFMRGKMASRSNPADRLNAAQMLARIHRAGLEYPGKFLRPGHASLANFDWEENSNWQLAEIQDLLTNGAEELKQHLFPPIDKDVDDCIIEIVARRRQLEQELKVARDSIEQLKNSNRQIVFAPTHGDYYPSNLLAESNQISAVLDWDECQSEWLVYELGRAVWEFCRDENTGAVVSGSAKNFLQAYTETGGVVPENEFDLLTAFIRSVRVQEILFSLGEALRGEFWDPKYTLYNFTALDNLRHTNLFRGVL